jgi:hypothetical protein
MLLSASGALAASVSDGTPVTTSAAVTTGAMDAVGDSGEINDWRTVWSMPNGTVATGAIMDAAGDPASAEITVWRTVWRMADGTPVTTGAIMDAAKVAVKMEILPNGSPIVGTGPTIGVNKVPLGLSSD